MTLNFLIITALVQSHMHSDVLGIVTLFFELLRRYTADESARPAFDAAVLEELVEKILVCAMELAARCVAIDCDLDAAAMSKLERS